MSDKEFDNLPEERIEVETPKPAKEYLEEYYKTLGDGSSKFIGIETGLTKLDQRTLGLDGVIVLGGIAGGGKTSLALQISYDACKKGTPVLFYSLEMPRRAIYTKLLNRLARVGYGNILLKGKPYLAGGITKGGRELFTQEEMSRLHIAKKDITETSEKFYIRSRETGQDKINFKTVEAEINAIKAKHNQDKLLVLIDHLQVFDIEGYRDQIDKEGKLINGFKEISEKTGATILLISQKNKAGFDSKGLGTLKGSVDIIYLADIVMTLESNKKDDDEEIADYGDMQTPKEINLHILKNRYNAPGKIPLKFNGAYSTFTEA